MKKTLCLLTSVAALALGSSALAAPKPDAHAEALDILTRSVAFRTVQPGDQVVPLAGYLKSVLVANGFKPEEVEITPVAGSGVLIARYPGKNKSLKPIVLLGHMDVVEARREDWVRDPFVPVVENGYVFGRGAEDNKFDVSMMVATLARLRREGWVPGREIILALSGDEETVMATTRYLAERLKGAELALNGDAGGGTLGEDGKPVLYALQAAEKTYADFLITVTDPGGHSSRPGATTAIYRMGDILGRLHAYQFPAKQSELTAAYFRASAAKTSGPISAAMTAFVANPRDEAAIALLSAEPEYIGQVRTTCVATMVNGGHAPNALPQKATATVNCRIFPGTPSEEVRKTLETVMADPQATIVRNDDGSVDSPASPLRADVTAAVTRSIHKLYPGLAIVPSMSAGATDSMWFRAAGVPSYGVAGLFSKPSDSFAHGLNERVPVAAIDGALAHWDSLLRDLAK